MRSNREDEILVAAAELREVLDGSERGSVMAEATSRHRADLSVLTPRQIEILRLFVIHACETEIGRELGIAAKTVENHLYRIQEKLNLASRAELMRAALLSLED